MLPITFPEPYQFDLTIPSERLVAADWMDDHNRPEAAALLRTITRYTL
jgi:hypothetical protein